MAERQENPVVASVAEGLSTDTGADESTDTSTDKSSEEGSDESSDEERLEEAAREEGVARGGAVDVTTVPDIAPQEEPEVETPAMARLRVKEPVQRKPSKKQQKEEREAAKQALKPSSTLPRSTGALRDLVPGPEKLKVHFSKPGEKRILVGIFSPRDIPTNQDAETFIYNKFRHKGSGTYELTVADAARREFPAGEVELDVGEGTDSPAPVAGGTSVADLLQTMLTRDGEDRKQLTKELATVRSKPETDPVDMLGRMHDLQQKVTPDNKENEGTLAALIQSMSQQSRDFMQMMLQQQAKSEERMALLMAPRESTTDKIMVGLVTKLLEDKTSSSGNLPAPLPPPNPTEDLKNMAEVFVMMQPKETGNSMVDYLMKKEEQERLGPKEIISLFNEARGERGTDDFKKSMDNFQFMMTALQSFRQQVEPGGATGFFDALGALFSNRDFASSIAGAIRTKTTLAQQQGVGAGQQTPPRLSPGGKERISAEELSRRTQVVHQRRVEIAQRKLQAETDALEQETAAVQPQKTPQPPVVTAAPAAPVAEVQPEPAEQPVVQAETEVAATATVTEEEAAEATQRVVAQEGAVPDIPPEIGDHINSMLAAEDDAALVECVVRLLQYLAELPYWKNFANTVFVLMQQGDKPRVLETVRAFFDGLEGLGYISSSLTQKVLKVFEIHFTEIVTHTRKASGLLDEEDEEDEEQGLPTEDGGEEPGPDEEDKTEGSEPVEVPGT